MKGRGCAKPTVELIQTGPSLILKFAIFWNFKTRLGPVWTNSMEGVSHPLLFL